MREASLRWALILGGIAALLGVAAAFAGNLVIPRSGNVDINHAVLVLLVAGLFALLALGIALGLAYFAGLRAERERPRTQSASDPDLDPAAERRDSALAGLIVMAIYWVVTTLYGVLFGPHTNGPAANGGASLLIQRVVIGIVFVLLGFGLGALGGRAPAARRLLDEIAGSLAAPAAPTAPSGQAANTARPVVPDHAGAYGRNGTDGNLPGGAASGAASDTMSDTPAVPPSDAATELPPA